MAEQPRLFTVAPWGHRVLTPWLASAVPTREVARAFRVVMLASLLAASGALYLYLRVLGHGMAAAVAGAALAALLPPVTECLRYVFLVEPLAYFLETAFLVALQAGAGLGPLCLIVVLGTLAKEFFVLLVPIALVIGPRPLTARARTAVALTALAVATAYALRRVWTPHLEPPLPAASPGTLILALHRFHDSLLEWWPATLLAGVTPLAVLGTFRAAAAPMMPVALYIAALALVPPFLNPVAFFSSDVPRLLLYTVPVAIPLAVTALRPPGPALAFPAWRHGPRIARAAAGLAALCALAPLAIVDRYRRADLSGPRDGPYVLAVAHETGRAARRLARGEEVVLDPEERHFVWGESHPSEMDRMRWFLREGWGQRAHYGTGEVVMHEPRATLLLPVMEPQALEVEIHVQAPRRTVLDAAVNGRVVATWAAEAESAPRTLAVPADALLRGDNELALSARDGVAGARLRRLAYRAAR
jgi:hypothetical protein